MKTKKNNISQKIGRGFGTRTGNSSGVEGESVVGSERIKSVKSQQVKSRRKELGKTMPCLNEGRSGVPNSSTNKYSGSADKIKGR